MKEFGSFYKSTENRKFNTWCKYTKRLDVYGCGCQHDCHYCYAKSLLSFRGLWNPKTPSVANIDKMLNRIANLPRNEVVKLGGMTDCFQPIERTKRLTYTVVKLLNHYHVPYLIVTKGTLVAHENYLKIYDKSLAHFQITITSTDKNVYEKCPKPSDRVRAIEKLQDAGFDVSLRLSPFIEQNVDVRILSKIKCEKILVEFLKVNHWIEKSFDIDYKDYTLKYGGYRHLSLEKKIELVNKVSGFCQISVGEYVREHHIYFSENVNPNKDDCCNLNKRDYPTYTQDRLFEPISLTPLISQKVK